MVGRFTQVATVAKKYIISDMHYRFTCTLTTKLLGRVCYPEGKEKWRALMGRQRQLIIEQDKVWEIDGGMDRKQGNEGEGLGVEREL